MADYPYGTPVVYEIERNVVAPLAFIAVKSDGQKADLAVMSDGGSWAILRDVPRSSDGGKNTWRTILEKAD